MKSCYRTYLERIVEGGDYGYEEIVEILNRHTTLQDANNDLMSHSNEVTRVMTHLRELFLMTRLRELFLFTFYNSHECVLCMCPYLQQEKEVDECRVRLQDMKTKMQNEMLVLNSYIQKLQHDLELIRDDVKQLEEEKHQLEEGRKDATREYSQVIQSIRNIFSRCSSTVQNKSVFVPSANGVNTDEWLEFINTRITDMIEISREFKDSGGGTASIMEEGSSISYATGMATDTSKLGMSPMMSAKPSLAILPPINQKSTHS